MLTHWMIYCQIRRVNVHLCQQELIVNSFVITVIISINHYSLNYFVIIVSVNLKVEIEIFVVTGFSLISNFSHIPPAFFLPLQLLWCLLLHTDFPIPQDQTSHNQQQVQYHQIIVNCFHLSLKVLNLVGWLTCHNIIVPCLLLYDYLIVY